MTGRTPPPPRSGRLTAGGPNSLELIWALLLLSAVAAGALVVAIAWTALWAEAQLAGTTWTIPLTDMPRLLLELAGSTRPAAIDQTVVAPWRPATIAALLIVMVTAVAVAGLRGWARWQAGWRHRQRLNDRNGSHVWARRRDLGGLTAPVPHRSADEPPAAGRLWVGSHHGRDILVPAATSVMAVAPTRTGKSTRLVVPNLLRWDGPAVVTSVKRDVHDLSVDRRRSFGPTMLFDPTGATGLKSVRWSPLLSSTTFPDATKTATWLADAAAVEDRHEAAKFWETLATKLLAPLLFAATNISAAPDGGLSISEGSERIDVAPPGFLRTLPHGTAVMLTGNTPPALISTHAYYEQHRWRNLIDRSQLHRYRKMHTGTGPATADAWEDTDGDDPRPIPSSAATESQTPRRPSRRSGGIGRRLHANYPDLPSRPDPRRIWGPGGNAIPNHLSTAPSNWPAIRLPPHLAAGVGADHADLAEPGTRREVLPRLLEAGPAPLIAATLTLPQLRDEWPHLDLNDFVRQAWEQSYPELADDLGLAV